MEHIVSFAYSDEAHHWCDDKDAISIDVLNSNFGGVRHINNFEHLKRFRCTLCKDIKQLIFTNCPQLEAIEAQFCPNLQRIIIKNCPNIRAIDVAESHISELVGLRECHNLQYLSIPYTEISKALPPLPSLLYLDIHSCGLINDFDITKYPMLEEFRGTSPQVNLNHLIEHENIVNFMADNRSVIGEINKDTKFKSLQFLSLKVLPSSIPANLFVYNKGTSYGEFPKQVKPCKWRESALLLYGPWGIPAIDKQLYTGVDNIDIHQICSLPDNLNKERAANAIAGAIFGSAIMDMVGVGVEFMNEAKAKLLCREKFDMTWSHPIDNAHNTRFLKGTATDDTSQAVLIMRTLVKASDPKFQRPVDDKSLFKSGPVFIDTKIFAEQLIDWIYHGHREHRQNGGLGVGRTVYSVVTTNGYVDQPVATAELIWESSGRKLAANGSVMRNAPCGCLCFWDENVVKDISEYFGKCTHYDPRCVFSCVCASIIQSRFIQKAAGLISDVDIVDSTNLAFSLVPDAENYPDIQNYLSAETVDDLELADEKSIGYTLKAFGSALWAVKYAESFTDAMEQIISRGGDSDTNGAVVGALMGAKCGFDQLPLEALQLMHCNEWLYQETAAFLKLMGLDPPPRRW